MKIRRLELKAFGPFTDRSLDFSSEVPGLHVVYGANEAGKSSSLRALQALFFGFPVRTHDDFQHRYEQLLVGGCLQGHDGRELSFFRRKKNKNSLFDPQDNPLDPTVLAPFLHGLEQDVFSTLYGIDHETLVKGGQSILEQQGEVGQALFAAGTGLASLKAIVDELEAEGDNLYRPRGSSQAISVALAQYKELQAQIKQVSLSSRDWQEHQWALDEAGKQLAAANALRGQLNREKQQLARLKQALPYLGQRRNLLGKLAELGEVVELPADFGERRRQLEHLAREARSRLASATDRLRDREEKSRGISINQGLLDHAEEIEELHQGLGQYRKGKTDSPQLEGRRIGCRTEAANLLHQIRPGGSLDAVESLRPSLAKRKTIQTLGARHEAIVQKVRQVGRLVDSTAKELANTRNDLCQLSPVAAAADGLARVVMVVRKAGDLDGGIAAQRQNLAAARKECQTTMNRLGLLGGAVELVAELAVPLPETIQRHEEAFRALGEEIRQLQVEGGQLSRELAQLAEQRREIEYAAEVPTEEELGQYRRRRDQGWQLLRRQWLHGENVAVASRAYDPEQPLPEAYEKLVGVADQAADRLYREADRVQKHASLKARGEGIERRLVELREKKVSVEMALVAAERCWQELWAPSGINALSPREMHAWLNGFEKLRFQVLEAAKIAEVVAEQEVQRRELRGILVAELGARGERPELPGEDLSPVLNFSEALVQLVIGEQARRERLEGKCRDLEKVLEAAQRDQNEAVEEQQQWQSRWDEALAPLGLAGQTLPAEALDALDTIQGCFDKLQEADVFRKRIEGIARDACEFEEKVLALVQEIAPGLSSLDAPQAIAQLKGRLGRASQEQAVLQQYAAEIETLERTILACGGELAGCEEQLLVQHRLAGCEGEERLNEAERRSCEYLQLKDKLAGVDEALARIAEGVSLADLEEQTQELDPDALPGRIEGLANEIEGKLDPEIRLLSETIGREKNELARMDGSSKAEELADASQQILTKIRRLTERYIRVKLATKILREEIERYRAENQDPVLKIAGRYFRELTMGSLVGLRTDGDEQGQPVLVGVRPNGEWLPVAAMSSGTRDQLYLALRLATLEWHLQFREPMPFIVDDILINFDDQRSLATLNALAELAEKTQVILFTHHSQIFQAAQALEVSGRVFAHQL
ncbi:MAG: AAA family ATPase [Desulfobulbaceae bacterium]|nr:AAA family ATPase [Desulfobulbaceae bacterium]